MHHMKFPPSTDLWVCEHQYSYPDICPQCKEEKMQAPQWSDGIIVYVWANSMEEAITELSQGSQYPNMKEAEQGLHHTEHRTIWEITIRRKS